MRTTRPAEMPDVLAPADPRYPLERYTVRTAAAYLEISESLMYQLAGRREIAYRRLGRGRILFSQADLDAWREAHRVSPKTIRTGRSVSIAAVSGATAPALKPLTFASKPRFS